jgi:hypothetical protein
MASSYTDILKLEIQADGENNDTWGANANQLFNKVEDTIAGKVTISPTADLDLTTSTYWKEGTVDTVGNMIIQIDDGGLSADFALTFPNKSHIYIVFNNTAYVATLKCGAFTTSVTLVAGERKLVQFEADKVYLPAAGAANVTGMSALTAQIVFGGV